MALIELLQKTDDADLKSLAELTLQRLMAVEVEGLCGAARQERSKTRSTTATATAPGHSTRVLALSKGACAFRGSIRRPRPC
jgi:transposase-like protein